MHAARRSATPPSGVDVTVVDLRRLASTQPPRSRPCCASTATPAAGEHEATLKVGGADQVDDGVPAAPVDARRRRGCRVARSSCADTGGDRRDRLVRCSPRRSAAADDEPSVLDAGGDPTEPSPAPVSTAPTADRRAALTRQVGAARPGGWPRTSSISSAWRIVMPTSSRPFEEPVLGRPGPSGTARRCPTAGTSTDQALDVDDDLGLRVGLDRRPDRLDGRLGQHDRHEAVLRAVVAEDVREARRDHGVEAVLLDRPHGVLARRADAERRPGDEDRWRRRSARR